MTEKKQGARWWQTLPGIVKGTIGVIAGITSILVALDQLGWFSNEKIWDIELPAYVITDSAFATEEGAGQRLVELSRRANNDPYFKEEFSNFGFFWIPDFKYLTNKKLFQVYIGPYKNKEDAYEALCDYNKRYNQGSYGILLSDKPGRVDLNCNE